MRKSLRLATALGMCAAVGGLTFAAARDILNPKMTPEKGTYDAPHGKLGDKPENPWSVTTVAAAVDGKPLPGKVTTLVGEVVDYSCYLQVGKHGGKHRDCGQKCLRNGQPFGLLTKEGTLYLLMDEEHDPRRDGNTALRAAAIEHMAHVVEATGTVSEVNGQRAMYVQGFVKK